MPRQAIGLARVALVESGAALYRCVREAGGDDLRGLDGARQGAGEDRLGIAELPGSMQSVTEYLSLSHTARGQPSTALWTTDELLEIAPRLAVAHNREPGSRRNLHRVGTRVAVDWLAIWDCPAHPVVQVSISRAIGCSIANCPRK